VVGSCFVGVLVGARMSLILQLESLAPWITKNQLCSRRLDTKAMASVALLLFYQQRSAQLIVRPTTRPTSSAQIDQIPALPAKLSSINSQIYHYAYQQLYCLFKSNPCSSFCCSYNSPITGGKTGLPGGWHISQSRIVYKLTPVYYLGNWNWESGRWERGVW
jgi:hypothetical protein